MIDSCEHITCGICAACSLEAACDPPLVKPARLQLSRQRGFDIRAYSQSLNGLLVVNCTRPGPWGNPYRVVLEHSDFKEESEWRVVYTFGKQDTEVSAFALQERAVMYAVDMFTNLIEMGGESPLLNHEAIRRELRGRNLACWCPLPKGDSADVCHAAVLLRVANA